MADVHAALARVLASAQADRMADGARQAELLVALYASPRPAAFVVAIWRGTRAPATALSTAAWVALFRRAGYSHNGRPAARPTEPVRVHRGATAAGRRGMAWTTRRDVAERFARQPGGQVWTATLEPRWLLAYVNDPRQPEAEYVVDPGGLGTSDIRPDQR